MAALIRALFELWGYTLRAAPILLAGLLATTSYFAAIKAGIRLWDDSPSGSPNTPDYFVSDFSWLRLRDGGKSRLELQGETLTHIPADDLLRLEPVRAMRTRSDAPALNVTAGHAVMNNQTGEVRLEDGVVIDRAAGRDQAPIRLQAPRVLMDTDRETLYARDNPTLSRGGQTLRAREITLRQLSGELSASQQVSVVLPSTKSADIP